MLRIYDEFLEDETIGDLKDRSYRLHVSALIYCSKNLTDGEVTEKGAKVLQIILGFQIKRNITELVEAGLWIPLATGGWVIRNYLEFNPKAETVKKERKQARERMRNLRDKRASDSDDGSPEGNSECSDERAGEGHGAVPNQSFPAPSFKDLNQRPLDQEIEKELNRLREAS